MDTSFVDPHSVKNKYNMTSTSTQYPAPEHGGRIPNIRESSAYSIPSKPYLEGPVLYDETTRQKLIGFKHTATPLNTVFFSPSNIEVLQKGIADQVYAMSGNKYHIDRQSDDDLKIIMRSYYLSFGGNNPNNVAAELQDLNSRVIGFSASKIYPEVDFHMFYLKDLEDFAPPIANPTNANVYGTRYGELKSFF